MALFSTSRERTNFAASNFRNFTVRSEIASHVVLKPSESRNFIEISKKQSVNFSEISCYYF